MRSGWVVVVLALAACGDDGTNTSPRDANTPIDVAPDVPACMPTGTPQTVYLNFTGATYSESSVEDSVANTSNVLDMQRTLAAWPHSNTAAIKACITTRLAGFNLDIVDVDPGTVAHHEIVFSTTYWDQANVPSISAIGCGTPNPKSVTFLFGVSVGTDPVAACEYAVLQFATSSTGLDHSLDCHDYLGNSQTACGAKTFVDMDIQCGEFQARLCTCTGSQTQNSFQRMQMVHGSRCP